MNFQPINLLNQFIDASDNPPQLMIGTDVGFTLRSGLIGPVNSSLHNCLEDSRLPREVTIKKKSEKKKTVEISKTVKELNYVNYFRNNVHLNKLKLDELKYIAKHNALKITGTKTILIGRISELFKLTKPVVKIQSVFRRWIVQESLKMRGPSLKKRSLCVNDTDFVSMEPIIEIPTELFYSYQDSKHFIYGFNLSSLIQVFQKNLRTNEKIENPYNREVIDGRIVLQILRLYRFCFIIYPDFIKENAEFVKNNTPTIFRAPLIHRTPQHLNDFNNLMTDGQGTIFADYTPIITTNYQVSQDQYERINRLREIRNMTIDQRVNNLFIEIDHLGNYTQASWFNLLERAEYINFYRNLYEIWYYRNTFTRDVRYGICPFLSPFYNVGNIRNIIYNMNTADLKQLCLISFENLVYTGIDDDHRKLGTMHALSALTLVSLGARVSLPWLYESVAV